MVSCAKTAEQFEILTPVGPRKHLLGVGAR